MFLWDNEGTAYHEAGHAVMGCVLGRSLISVDIVEDMIGGIGHTHFWNDVTKGELRSDSIEKHEYVKKLVLTELTASIAHDMQCPGRTHDCADRNDEARALDFLLYINLSMSERGNYLRSRRDEAKELISHHWSWVEALALALIEKRELQGLEVLALRR